MDLEKEVNRLFDATAKTDLDILPSIASAEEFLKESYEGRYFFELIQNARDANKALNKQGIILIQLKEHNLNISNTGAPFSATGVASICRIGQSDKASQDFIGHKGIGFKSVQEITERPIIITEFGTLYFSREKTSNRLRELHPNELIELDQIPLFFFPHFAKTVLEKNILEGDTGFVTRIELPFRDGVLEEKVFNDFAQIAGKQLVLLGNIRTIELTSRMGNIRYDICSKPTSHFVEVSKNGTTTFFKEFRPRRPIKIPDTVYLKLEKREKELFKKDRSIEIKILLEWDKKARRPLYGDGMKLYLFYPLEITSGFRFLIHSYFSVNPARKELRKTDLNRFILRQIAEYITGQFLDELKQSNKASLLEILYFQKIPDSGLDTFYDDVVALLNKTRFIYDSATKQFYTPDEVMVADDFDKELFSEGRFAGKRLIFIGSEEMRDWLITELKIPYLSFEFIREHIETECMRQRKKRNTTFFQVLYNYVSDHDDLNLQGKRILLTEHYGLVNDDVDVFYGGARKRIFLPKALRKKITFIHKDITISDFRDGRSRTGITEFSTYALVSKLLKLFDDPEVDHAEIIRTLKTLDLDRKSVSDIKSRIRVPIKESTEWLNPLYHPIYLDSADIRELFPQAHVLHLKRLLGGEVCTDEWKRFLKTIYIWDKPALYLNTYQLDTSDPRNNGFVLYTGKSSKPFTITNDRCLDVPVTFNRFFFEKLINQWDEYIAYIEDSDLPPFSCRSYYSGYSVSISGPSKLALTHFVAVLKTRAWIWIADGSAPVSRSTAVAINLHDFEKGHLQVLKKYLNIVPVDYLAKQNLIDVLQIHHLSKTSVSNYICIFQLLHHTYAEPPQTKDFVDCFNRILTFLFEFYFASKTPKDDVINRIRGNSFLAVDDVDGRSYWELVENILYIDNKLLYDQLPTEIKAKLQPVFTNRDKNTFGKIASQIGRVLSKSVDKKVVSPVSMDSVPLIKAIPDLPELVAFLESHIQRPFSDVETDDLRKTHFVKRRDLKTKLVIKGNGDFEALIDEDFAIDLEEGRHFLNVKPYAWENVKTKAQALTRLFEEILDLDLRTFAVTLGMILREPSETRHQRMVLDYDVSPERINEIRSLLEEQVFSPIQQFWMVILHCKHIASGAESFVDATVDFCWLARNLKIPEAELQGIHSRIDYSNLCNPNNITVLESLFERLDMKLGDFNLISYSRISFRNHHEQELMKLRNKLERKFESYLYYYLAGCSEREQSQFQNLLQAYQCLEPEVEEEALKLDHEKRFYEALKATFRILPVSVTALKHQSLHTKMHKIFYSNKKRLISALKKARLPTDYVEEYLKNDETRSQLCFVFNKKHVGHYHAQFKKEIDAKVSSEAKQSTEVNLAEYQDTGHKEIEDYKSKAVDIPQPKGPKSGGGWGWTPPGKSRDELVGEVGEWNVFQKIKENHPSAKWVSRYAYKAGINPEGKDGLGYDIEYVDDKGNKVYIEVKAREGGEKSFKISINEIRMAQEARDNYQIIFVSHTLNNKLRSYRNLGNIFIYEDNEDFMNNRRFRAINEEYKIVFE